MEKNYYLSFYVSLFMLLAMTLSSCGPVLYTGVGHNVPLFQKKGEVVLSAGGSAAQKNYDFLSTDFAEGFHAQVAASTGEHTAIISSYYLLKGKDEWSGSGNYFELGIGKFKHYETKYLTAEVFIGAGMGSLKNSFDGSYVKVKYVKPFIQPSVGFSIPHFEIAFTPRIALVSFTSKSENLVNDDNNQFKTAFDDFWSEKKNTVVLEPGITIRAGFKKIKFQAQYSYTMFDFTSKADDYSPVYKNFGSMGLFFLISDRKARTYSE